MDTETKASSITGASSEAPSGELPKAVAKPIKVGMAKGTKILIGILSTLSIIGVIVLVVLNLNKSQSSNKGLQELSDADIPVVNQLDETLLSSEISLCPITVEGATENVECQAYSDAGWYVSSRGDFQAFYCYSIENGAPVECFRADVAGVPRQWCSVTGDEVTSNQECDIKTAPNLYTTVRGDSIDIFCSEPDFPLAMGCTYQRVVSQCRVNHEGTSVDVGCSATEDGPGRYETTQGDLKMIYCTENEAPMATGCLYIDVNGAARQWCRMAEDGTDQECDALATSGQYESVRGDAIVFTCTPSFPLATNCVRPAETVVPTTTSTPRITPTIATKCNVWRDDKWNSLNCTYSNSIFTALYEGDAFSTTLTLSCTNIYAPTASGCKVNHAVSQVCEMTNGNGSVACRSLGGSNYRAYNPSGAINVTCATPGYPIARSCAVPISTPTSTPAVTTQCDVRSWRDYSAGVQDCTQSGPAHWFVTTRGDEIKLYCKNLGVPTATDCIRTNDGYGDRQWCWAGSLFKCDAISGEPGHYEAAEGDSIQYNCTNAGYPYATGCTRL